MLVVNCFHFWAPLARSFDRTFRECLLNSISNFNFMGFRYLLLLRVDRVSRMQGGIDRSIRIRHYTGSYFSGQIYTNEYIKISK